jgi:two-component system cell cycle sensor histidine kinase/response regulator CckA
MPGETQVEGVRLLLVDDDPAVRRAYCRTLASKGVTVEAVSSGSEAIARVVSGSFDVILSDISMPQMTGLELLRAVRASDLDVPVILMSGAPELESALAAVEYGAFCYLTKPVATQRLHETVFRAARLHEIARLKRAAIESLGRDGSRLGERAALEVRFVAAMKLLWMAFQPIIDWRDRRVFGYEALVRTGEPSMRNPLDLIDAAERLGRLSELGRTIRARVASAAAGAPPDAKLFVNLHSSDLNDEELFSASAPLSMIAHRVVLEVTERASLYEVKDVMERIIALKALGFQVAIDDLGAGYSGLTCFTQLEPEVAKFDMSLVRGVDTDSRRQTILRSMTHLCDELGILVVAEGVETASERDTLAELGCNLFQGYHFGKPAREFEPMLAQQSEPGKVVAQIDPAMVALGKANAAVPHLKRRTAAPEREATNERGVPQTPFTPNLSAINQGNEQSALANTEELFRAFFHHSPVGRAITGLDGSWLYVNAALVDMLGYSAEELQATTFLAITHPDDLGETREAVRRLLSHECSSCSLDKRFLAKDGSYAWSHVTTRIHRCAAGETQYFLTDIVDVTRSKNADAELLSSEERYRRLFESAKDGILILDATTGIVVEANPFMTELTGFARRALVGRHLWEIGPFADSASSKTSFAELQDKNYVRYDDLPLRTKGGLTVDVEFVSNVYLVNDKRVVQCNIRDISSRKRAEHTLRLRERAIEAVLQGIVITDPTQLDNPIIYASPGFSRLTGYDDEEILGQNCRFLQGPGTDTVQISMLRDAIREGRACTVEVLNFRKDGSPFWNNVAISPVREGDGQVTNYVGVQTDVTSRRQLEAQLLHAQKMEAVGRLAGGLAHDFNNILSVILSYAELICDDIHLEEPLRADVSEIKAAGLRAADLTRQLLAFSRQQVLDPKVLNLNQSLAGMEKMLRRLLGADIEITILPAVGLGNVKADPGQVEQIIMNLAVNARDAMPQGGKLTIETANIELDDDYAREHHEVRAGSHVLMAVSDTGAGMDKETVARIFDPFFTTKEQGKGTGLGLATVFGIVKQSGGHIFVYSEPGKGSAFKIYLPKVGARIDEAPAAEHEPLLERGGYTILLVEDGDQVRNLARTILRRQGFVVLDAPNGGEALLICERHEGNIDLLLTDVVLPRMSGRQLAERLVPMRPGMKVLYMSGYTDDAILQHGIIDSGFAFLQKPFTPTTLTRKVAEVLRSEAVRTRVSH